VEARFSPFGDSANLDTRKVHGLRRTYHMLRTISSVIVLDAPDGSSRCEAQVDACISLFGDSANLDAR
jgi:hypothetical protein